MPAFSLHNQHNNNYVVNNLQRLTSTDILSRFPNSVLQYNMKIVSSIFPEPDA